MTYWCPVLLKKNPLQTVENHWFGSVVAELRVVHFVVEEE